MLSVAAMKAVLVLALALSLAGMTDAGLAQDLPGNVGSGKRLAETWCGACHRVDANVGVIEAAADFYSIANLPSTTALSLKVFLQTSHKEMPNFRLTQTETDDVIAYILSMKKSKP